ncbi:nickel pincer cofactor biosynthesis protein LarB [Alkalihalobacillus hwajinpoensis]|uniref:nickel pincer cofactor biosynthesis protein LarB n=1 Tax=Guptibacillus hwajinpoensis TaxID=208199 RepID=UPI001883E84D|nr:nickel pincer cofactor biosynthesis protein LarB [Pseudalkalibacillus hwajinpoensis]MBF0707801.1 nickel pincer cofactor biosynthesis protein LarB [Pseudalkalibacillus hwajinpoensis]
MGAASLEDVLNQVKEGSLDVKEAKTLLSSFEDIGFAKVDHQREDRTGFPEVIYGEGKTVEQMIDIIQSLKKNTNRVLATRITEEKAAKIMNIVADLDYNESARTLFWKHPEEPALLYNGYIAVLCAGTSDLPVAEEAAVTAEAFGASVKRMYDVGVAGIHRLFHHLEEIENATVAITVAGMEGALTSVVGGLISNPIVAVPTSIGYGANFQGLSSLLSMLNACSPGISVMNIDNGFGAGYYATLIHKNHRKTIVE